MTYDQDLVVCQADFEELVKKWERQRYVERQAPILRKAKILNGIWENLFVYGTGIGIIVQIALWYQFAIR